MSDMQNFISMMKRGGFGDLHPVKTSNNTWIIAIVMYNDILRFEFNADESIKEILEI